MKSDKLSKTKAAIDWAYRSGYCFGEEAAKELAAHLGESVRKHDLGQYGDSLEWHSKSEELPGVTTADPDEAFSGVSSNLRRTGLMGVFLACVLALSGIAHAADLTTGQPKAPRAKPISTISVKVQPAAKMDGKPWRITTADQDSCVAWVSTTAPNLEQAELQAFRECRKAINGKVDEAAEKAGV